jgi:predicted O-linked N-acetylglucosamine transferase (SPINDLY family)
MNPLIASLLNQAVQYLQNGNPDRAEALLKQVLQIHSKNFDALHVLGMVKGMKNDHAGAREYFKQAVAVNPGSNFAQFNLAKALSECGDDAAAIAHHNKATRLAPDHPQAWLNFGRSLNNLRRHEAALDCYRKAVSLNPGYAEAWANMGTSLNELKRHEEALSCYAKALQGNPNLAELWSNQGGVLDALQRYDEALASYDNALRIAPGDAHAWFNRGLTLSHARRYEEALAAYDKSLDLNPGQALAWAAKAFALNQLWRFKPAQAASEMAVSINPEIADAWGNLGLAVQEAGRPAEALEHYLQALALEPDLVEVRNNYGNALQELGRLDEAVLQYRQALSIRPGYAQAYSNLLFVQAYHAIGERQEYLALARGWESACISEPVRRAARGRIFHNRPLAGRRLKVGYVSGDLRQHAASYFVEQLFACHDRDLVELFAYSAHAWEDAVSARLRASVDHWVPIAGTADAVVRSRVQADGIDVLIDLSGHTANSRLEVFAHRAAPVQAHYLGYFASTGLTEMDYWIGDVAVTPPAADCDFSEQVWRLPRVWVGYQGKAEAPAPDRRAQQDAGVWIGSFNSLRKLTPRTMDIWARILGVLPEGRLLLKTKELSDPANRVRIFEAMESRGIGADRVELLDGSTTPDWPAHMACYDRLDLALDPVGAVGGGTTTCDALWMAVPVVTIEGDRMASRMSASMLRAVGHPEWIAQGEDDYIQKVVELARDPDRRAGLRATLREQMAASALCDARDLARSLEQAYSEMFNRWLAKER